MVDSAKLDIHLNIATDSNEIGFEKPYYMASIGKVYTAVLISILFKQGKLSFEDRLTDVLDNDLLKGLHIYMEKDYTDDIKIRHLLNHTSGLAENFWPLLDRFLKIEISK